MLSLPSPRQVEEQGTHNTGPEKVPGRGESCYTRQYRRLVQGKGPQTPPGRAHAASRLLPHLSSSAPLPCIFPTRVPSLRVGNPPALVNSLSNLTACTGKALQELGDKLGDHTDK